MSAPEHAHKWATLASWPSGPDGETDRLVQCTVTGCGELVTRAHDEDDDGLTEPERAIRDGLDRAVEAYIESQGGTEALLNEVKRRAGDGD